MEGGNVLSTIYDLTISFDENIKPTKTKTALTGLDAEICPGVWRRLTVKV